MSNLITVGSGGMVRLFDPLKDLSDVRLRPATLRDASAAGAICYSSFKAIAEKHAFAPDFPSAAVATELMQMMLSRPDIYGVAADRGGVLVGTNFLWEGGPVAGVGPITVELGVQNQKVGRRLMEAVLDRAEQKGIDAVRLVQAAYHGRSLSLYTKLGFVVREPLVVMQGKPLRTRRDGVSVRPAGPGDSDAAAALCRRVHGHDRTSEFDWAVRMGTAAMVERDGRITGYTTGVGFLGHTVGESTQDLQALIAAAPEFSGPGFLLPMRNTELFTWALAHGLRVVQPMTLMTIGAYQEPKGAYLPSVLF